jgi:hypothetical protein
MTLFDFLVENRRPIAFLVITSIFGFFGGSMLVGFLCGVVIVAMATIAF